MTEDNRISNSKDALIHARTCLREAETLHAAGLPYRAASRAYYAVFHAARALLFSAGLEAKSHRAVVRLLGEHFVKTGRLPASSGRLVSRMQRDREDADYLDGSVFTEHESAELIEQARGFLEAVENQLPV